MSQLDLPFIPIAAGFVALGLIGARHWGWPRFWIRMEELTIELDQTDKRLMVAGIALVGFGILSFLWA